MKSYGRKSLTKTIKDSSWLNVQNFSLGRWALGYPGLYVLYRVLIDVKPQTILEMGLGESSKIILMFLIILIHLDLIKKEIKDNLFEYKYANFISSLPVRKYNFICIDGPFGGNDNGRSEILDLKTNDMLADDFIILFDDTERKSESKTNKKIT